MPNLSQAKKRMRQSEAQRLRNRSRRSAVKTQVTKFLDAVKANDVDLANREYSATTKILDQNAAHGVFHKKTVARRKSRLAARLQSMKTST